MNDKRAGTPCRVCGKPQNPDYYPPTSGIRRVGETSFPARPWERCGTIPYAIYELLINEKAICRFFVDERDGISGAFEVAARLARDAGFCRKINWTEEDAKAAGNVRHE